MVYIKVETNLPTESIPKGAVQELIRTVSHPRLRNKYTKNIDYGATIHCNRSLGTAVPSARIQCFYLPFELMEAPFSKECTEKNVILVLHMMLGIPPERCTTTFPDAPAIPLYLK